MKKRGQALADGIKEDLVDRSEVAANTLSESVLGRTLLSSGGPSASAPSPLHAPSALAEGLDGSALSEGLVLDQPVEMLAHAALQPLADTAAGAIKVALQAWVGTERAAFGARLDAEFAAARHPAKGESLEDLHAKFVEAFPAGFVKRVLTP